MLKSRSIQAEKHTLQEQKLTISKDLQMEFEKHYLGRVCRNEDKIELGKYIITFRNYITGKTFSLNFSCGIGLKNNGRTVKPFDVLYCIHPENPQGLSFEDWCDDYGYDTDSRKALETYLACQKQIDDFKKVFPSVNLDVYEPLDTY